MFPRRSRFSVCTLSVPGVKDVVSQDVQVVWGLMSMVPFNSVRVEVMVMNGMRCPVRSVGCS